MHLGGGKPVFKHNSTSFTKYHQTHSILNKSGQYFSRDVSRRGGEQKEAHFGPISHQGNRRNINSAINESGSKANADIGFGELPVVAEAERNHVNVSNFLRMQHSYGTNSSKIQSILKNKKKSREHESFSPL
jgi:hypothetical protein